MHHATAGDLDRRGHGDVPTMTLEEYQAHDWPMRLGYRLFRNPIVMFGLGWLWGLVIQPRLVSKDARPRLKRSTHVTNLVLMLAVIAAMCLLVGPGTFFLVQGPAAALAGATGVFLFYVQHRSRTRTGRTTRPGATRTPRCAARPTSSSRSRSSSSRATSACTTCTTSRRAFRTTTCRPRSTT